ncbi:jg9014, partial [Pararge aegeria aegeria]
MEGTLSAPLTNVCFVATRVRVSEMFLFLKR